MIVSHYLSEPDSALARGHSLITPLPEFGSESFLSKVWRAVRRAVPLRLPSLGAARQPFQRLDFWTASHPLSYKLRLYQVSEPAVSIFRGMSWATLKYWELLFDEVEVPSWPSPEAPKARIYFPEYEMAYAKPFSD